MDWDPNELTPQQRADVAAGYMRHMFYGFLWCAGGTIVTLASMNSNRGGIIAWGAIVFGLIDFCRGLNGWITYR